MTGLDLFECCITTRSHSKRSTYSWILTLVHVNVAFIIPTLVMCIMYLRIFMAARTNSIRTRRNSSCSMTIEGVHQIKNNCNSRANYLSVSNYNLDRSPSVILFYLKSVFYKNVQSVKSIHQYFLFFEIELSISRF